MPQQARVHRRSATLRLDLTDPATRYMAALVAVLDRAAGRRSSIVRSAHGRVLVAIRENEERTKMLGYDTFANKLAAVVVSGTICAAAGAAYALLFGYVGSTFASVQYSILPLLWVLLGGAATTLGPLIGTLFMYYVVDVTSGYTSAYLLIVGVALILLVLFFPKGILGTIRERWVEVAAMTPLLTTKGLAATSAACSAVDDVDFAVMPGEIRAIIGPNGAGKTTFVSLICGRVAAVLRHDRLRRQRHHRPAAHQRVRRGIAYTFQITSVFANLTAYDNVALPVQRTLTRRPRARRACMPA